eukprot:COSAG03_NODE_14851_length_449_cov_116.371429_1_plen_61_part_01
MSELSAGAGPNAAAGWAPSQLLNHVDAPQESDRVRERQRQRQRHRDTETQRESARARERER